MEFSVTMHQSETDLYPGIGGVKFQGFGFPVNFELRADQLSRSIRNVKRLLAPGDASIMTNPNKKQMRVGYWGNVLLCRRTPGNGPRLSGYDHNLPGGAREAEFSLLHRLRQSDDHTTKQA